MTSKCSYRSVFCFLSTISLHVFVCLFVFGVCLLNKPCVPLIYRDGDLIKGTDLLIVGFGSWLGGRGG